MSDRAIPALLAVIGGLAVAALLFVPWVVYRYRRRGSFGGGDALLSLAAVVYGLALITFTILPLPDPVAEFCRVHEAGPQLHPLAVVSDVVRDGGLNSPLAILTNPAAAQVVLNVLFFVPLGMLVRHLFHRGIISTTLIGLATSLFIELTQLTGDWFLYPCAYRLFDVDDLAANGLGALIGALIAALLRIVPGQRSIAPSVPRPVTAPRRLVGMLVDLVVAALVTTAITVAITLIDTALGGPHGDRLDAVTGGIAWVAVIGHLIVVLTTGRTFGEIAVRLRPRRTLGYGARIARWLFGIGGVLALSAAGSGFSAFVYAVILVVIAIASRGHRGLGYLILRRELEDDRTASSAPAPIVEPEHRRAGG